MAQDNLITRIGLALYGSTWQTDMSRALEISDRTIRRWASGEIAPKDGIYIDLYRIALERITDIEDVIGDLQKSAGIKTETCHKKVSLNSWIKESL